MVGELPDRLGAIDVTSAPWRREVLIGLSAYAAYLGARQLVWNDAGRARARRNAERLLDAECRSHAAVERAVQRAALRAPRAVIDVLNAAYAAGNVGLTLGWLLRLYRCGDASYRRERRAAAVAFVGAVPVFALFPVAPPRTLDGFIDTLDERGISPERPSLTRFYNPVAAMPSLHLAFAVVSGVGLAARARTPWRRRAWLMYPGVVAGVVVATGNHLVADVVAGAVLGATARAVTR